MEFILFEVEHQGVGILDAANPNLNLHYDLKKGDFAWQLGIDVNIPIIWEHYSAAGPNRAVIVYQWCTGGECNADGKRESILVRSETELPPQLVRGMLAFLKRRAEISDGFGYQLRLQQEMMKNRAGGIALPGLVGPDRGLVA